MLNFKSSWCRTCSMGSLIGSCFRRFDNESPVPLQARLKKHIQSCSLKGIPSKTKSTLRRELHGCVRTISEELLSEISVTGA